MIKPDHLADGVPARIWEGQTESGSKIICCVSQVAIPEDSPDKEKFDIELQSCKQPSPEAIEAFPLRFVL